jgi:hypothetical protein
MLLCYGLKKIKEIKETGAREKKSRTAEFPEHDESAEVEKIRVSGCRIEVGTQKNAPVL